MGRMIECVGSYAIIPYYVNQAGLHLYSLEELCFYLKENSYLVDSEIMNSKLVDWIERQLKLPELARNLGILIRNEGTLGSFVALILESAYYFRKEEIGRIEQIVQENSQLNIREKRKRRADHLVKKKKYQVAIEEYEAILETCEPEEQELKESVYHNLGVCMANVFLFEQAAGYFMKSYEIHHDDEIFLEYLTAMKLCLDERTYREKIIARLEQPETALLVEQNMQEGLRLWTNSDEKVKVDAILTQRESDRSMDYYKKIDSLLAEWKEEFRAGMEK